MPLCFSTVLRSAQAPQVARSVYIIQNCVEAFNVYLHKGIRLKNSTTTTISRKKHNLKNGCRILIFLILFSYSCRIIWVGKMVLHVIRGFFVFTLFVVEDCAVVVHFAGIVGMARNTRLARQHVE